MQAAGYGSQAVNNFYQGNYLAGTVDTLGAIGGWLSFLRACFAAGTPIQTPEGAVAIEQIKPGDLVLSRSEFDPSGPIEAKVVEEVFVRVSPVLDLRVRGRTITTTGEHPFYAEGRGWTEAKRLEPGERILAMSGEWLLVEGVDDSGLIATVYNFRVADHHTYFVGCDEWGFSASGRTTPITVFTGHQIRIGGKFWQANLRRCCPETERSKAQIYCGFKLRTRLAN